MRAVAMASMVGALALLAVQVGAITPAGASRAQSTRTIPGAPTSVTAIGVDAAIDVSWTAPGSSGGSSVTGYSAHANGGGVVGSCRTNTTSCTITGLTNGLMYSVTARARSGARWSHASAAVTAVPSSQQNCGFVGPYGNLQGCTLAHLNLRSATLSHADLSNANLSGADLSYADLSGANLGGAALETTNLSGADLVDADLAGAFLGFADLSGAALYGADLTGVTWITTICPDGTNSNSDGGTCIGHGI
jgi:hypothetical protein